MFERFDEASRRALFFARFEASQLGSAAIDSEHLLLGLVRDEDSLVARILHHYGVSAIDVRGTVEKRVTRKTQTSTSVEIPFTADTRRILELAVEEADRLLHRDITTEHLLLGLLRVETSVGAQILQEMGLRIGDVRDHIVATRSAAPEWPNASPTGAEVRPPSLAAFRRAVRDGRAADDAQSGMRVSPSHGEPGDEPVVSMSPRRVTADGFTLAELMAWVYRMDAVSVDTSAMPHPERRYDLNLTLDRPESWPRIDALLRDGLARHFSARVWRETRRVDAYVLTAQPDAEPPPEAEAGAGGIGFVSATFDVVAESSGDAASRRPDSIENFAASGLTITAVCAALQELTGIPIADATGRAGKVDVHVEGETDADGLVRRVAEQLGVVVTREPQTIAMLVVRPQ